MGFSGMSRTQADARYPQLIGGRAVRYGGRVSAIGDSITANYGAASGATAYQPDNHFAQALILSGQSPLWHQVYAAGGYTLEQIRDTFVANVLALTPRPSACLVLGGTNNVKTDGTGTGYVVTDSIAVIQTICDTLAAASIVPILATIPPYGALTAINVNVDKFNRHLKSFAATRGYDLIDYHAALVDPTTGVFQTGLCQTDNVHPSYKGANVMALAAASFWTRFPRIAAPIADHKLDSTNKIDSGKGLFVADTNADGISDGWASFSGTGMTFTRVADGSLTWQRITMPSTGTGTGLLQWSATSLCSAGDIIELCGRVQTSGFTAAVVAPGGAGSGGTGPSWSMSASIMPTNDVLSPSYAIHTDVADGVLYGRIAAPAGATGQIKVNIFITGQPASGSVWAQWTNIALRNLTTLGLT